MRGFFLSIQHARPILELYGNFLELYCIYFAGFLRKKMQKIRKRSTRRQKIS